MPREINEDGVFCPDCGDAMIRNGRTAAGVQRYKCRECKKHSSRPEVFNDDVLGAVIRDIRNGRGIYIESAADQIEKTKSWLSRVESGEISIKVKDLFEIAHAYEWRASDIVQKIEIAQLKRMA